MYRDRDWFWPQAGRGADGLASVPRNLAGPGASQQRLDPMTRTVRLNLLDHLRIASPCSMKWEHLTPVGDGERVRRCAQCDLNVHNISGMSRDEAEVFLRSLVPGQRACGVFRRRSDGTIITRDCPVGVRAPRQKLVRWMVRAAAAVTVILTGAVCARA